MFDISYMNPMYNAAGERMREAEIRNEENLLRWKLENCYSQGRLEEAVKLGRQMDDMQCQLFLEASKPKKAAG